MLHVVHDGEAAEHDVAVGVAAEHPRGGHDPAHAERRADLLRLARRAAGADHLLQRDDVGVDAPGAPPRSDAGRVRPSSPRHRWML